MLVANSALRAGRSKFGYRCGPHGRRAPFVLVSPGCDDSIPSPVGVIGGHVSLLISSPVPAIEFGGNHRTGAPRNLPNAQTDCSRLFDTCRI